jgi:NTP pyrophosphatase (non-canonical NTP hydrolase)
MRIDEYQQHAARTMNRGLEPSDVLLDAAAGLCEEGGEVIAHVRKHLFQGRALKREEVAEELGDALWCLAAIATSLGFTLEDIARRNVAKLAARHPEGVFTTSRPTPSRPTPAPPESGA